VLGLVNRFTGSLYFGTRVSFSQRKLVVRFPFFFSRLHVTTVATILFSLDTKQMSHSEQNVDPHAALIQTITRIVQQALGSRLSQGARPHDQRPLPSLPPQQPSHLDPTPVLEPYTTFDTPTTGNLSRSSSGISTGDDNLSRSSSGISTASTSSSTSYVSASSSSIKRHLDFDAQTPDGPPKKRTRKRKRSDPQFSQDKKVVSGPVLAVLDVPFLAPRRSQMFRRQ